ncbi:hypothetical protein QF019_000342 [Pseudomonas frederiksbergensis]|uniref:DUF4406 domain-containing protein n=1 Tax=Pseudomonas frederiksbergensis TaxID=104087 RepID=UPI003D25D1B2
MKRIYLSRPMTGQLDLNFPAFAAMTANLRAGGHTVPSPAELNTYGNPRTTKYAVTSRH